MEETGKIAKILKEQEELRECRFYPETTPLNKKVLYGDKSPVKGFDENVYRMKKADFDRKLQNLVKENMGRSADEVMRSLERYEGFMQMLGINKDNQTNENPDPSSKTPPVYNFESEYVGHSDLSEKEDASINSEMLDLPPNTRKTSKKDTLRHINQKFAQAYQPNMQSKYDSDIDPKPQALQMNFAKKSDIDFNVSEQQKSNLISSNPEAHSGSNPNIHQNFLLSDQQNVNGFGSVTYTNNGNKFSVDSSVIYPSRLQADPLQINASSHYMPQPVNSLVNSSAQNSTISNNPLPKAPQISMLADNHDNHSSSVEYHHSIWAGPNGSSQEFVPTTPIAGYDTFKSEINVTPNNFTLGKMGTPLISNRPADDSYKERTSNNNCFENEVDIEEEAEEEIDPNDPIFKNDTSIGQPGRSTEIMRELMNEANSDDSNDHSENQSEVRPPYLKTFGNELDVIDTSGYLINLDIELPTGKHEQLHIRSFKEINSTIDRFVEQHNLIDEAKGYLKQLIADQLHTLGFGELSRDFIHN